MKIMYFIIIILKLINVKNKKNMKIWKVLIKKYI